MPPKLFREIFLPRYRRFCEFVKSRAPVKIALHSCGSVGWALEDLAAPGSTWCIRCRAMPAGWTTRRASRRRLGKRLAFYSNLCNQTILPHGTPEQVREDVVRKIRAWRPVADTSCRVATISRPTWDRRTS